MKDIFQDNQLAIIHTKSCNSDFSAVLPHKQLIFYKEIVFPDETIPRSKCIILHCGL